MIEVIPGINEQTFSGIENKLHLVENLVPWVHLDIVDELFNFSTFRDPVPFKNLKSKVKWEVHMMINNPEDTVGDWVDAGFLRFIGHVEGMKDIGNFIKTVRSYKKEVGLAVDIVTPVSVIEPYLTKIDNVLVMSIHTGKSGQSFMSEALDKIRQVRRLSGQMPIEVDGGVNLETGKMAVEAGVTRLVSTSYIFKAPNIQNAIKILQDH
ncbi:ribulose-phosphate 3-epimerase [Candidatus Gottesmanbacteria bacterium]|nr:ribulose-phosphate 3-epimerase [Candidatus Gottesmanbacteria bacterium]